MFHALIVRGMKEASWDITDSRPPFPSEADSVSFLN